jgi:hypothetical protein
MTLLKDNYCQYENYSLFNNSDLTFKLTIFYIFYICTNFVIFYCSVDRFMVINIPFITSLLFVLMGK